MRAILRQFLKTVAALPATAALLVAEGYRFRLAICNETFDGWNFRDSAAGAIH